MAAQQPKSSKTDLASLVCLAVLLALPLVGRFGLSAAQIFQNGPCSPSGGPFRPLSSPNPSKRTSPALPMGGGGVGWGVGWGDNVHVPVRTQARQPHQTRAGGGSLSLSFSPWWSVLAAQQPKSSKTDLASLVSLAVLLALPLVVRFGCSAAEILQNGPRQLGLLGCAPCSPSGVPFWPLSGPNPPKRTSPCWSAWLCSLLSLWWSVLAAQQPKSSKWTSSAWSAGLCSLLSLWWSVLAAQQPKSSKADLLNSATDCGCKAGSNPQSSG